MEHQVEDVGFKPGDRVRATEDFGLHAKQGDEGRVITVLGGVQVVVEWPGGAAGSSGYIEKVES
ncbi:hypothetical protein UFOVP1382_110 [uncultured Caudovirales phage]|uniref:DUF4314 domain-containing protein n=1 Tax=uncultured Caudovirales phage TaxID=2100421 RepID=A0A6J5RXY6_9CAUD|nr:hypothetical protein UFOVP1382_110 [uncultured Caudovirales phage]